MREKGGGRERERTRKKEREKGENRERQRDAGDGAKRTEESNTYTSRLRPHTPAAEGLIH